MNAEVMKMNVWEEKIFEGPESDLRLIYCGKRIGNIGHTYGPYDRESYLIYYIKEGRAELTMGDTRILLEGEGFFVNFPHSGCVYRADEATPWSIKWISADGELLGRYLALCGITPDAPFLRLKNGREIEKLFDEMYELFDRRAMATRIYCISLLHKLFSLLSAAVDNQTEENTYVERALAMIEERYADPALTVFSLATALGLHPNYFSILFKRRTGILPKRMILDVRMKNACKMLRFTDRPIKEIACEVGFCDELYFSRAFRAHCGVSPTAYRRSLSYPT